jgi:hypothetical protein
MALFITKEINGFSVSMSRDNREPVYGRRLVLLKWADNRRLTGMEGLSILDRLDWRVQSSHSAATSGGF